MARDCAVPVGVVYPSHLRPVEVQRLQLGLASSHLTLRILTFR